ncbi:hypothetical protein [[Muricauda] lutisoli]|uniref:RiboL-PSP-HEPN domain-containing protein n=1 Tax=[Muricauda] lutisoli TaxID=2816035 RepID=A0ABS3EXZ1_9FLAO|nr:hypothetical protein [[Muricauda] lutisoli]MBO0331130.1 hypothetical protein [[Muricauda] lutisoli]
MKHIKKRFLVQGKENEINFDKDKAELLEFTEESTILEKVKGKQGFMALLRTQDDLMIGGFIHKLEGKEYIFPVPDPTLIYFNNAQGYLRVIKERKTELLKKLNLDTTKLNEPALNELYAFYGATSGFVIFLFTSIESFINQMVPREYEYSKSGPRKTETYNMRQIQEYLDFKTKIKDVLQEVTGKDFFAKNTPTNQLIWNLKNFRDEIIHTKANENPLKYEKLIKTSLNFKYEKTLLATAKFMNFYKKDFIIECDCGQDF